MPDQKSYNYEDRPPYLHWYYRIDKDGIPTRGDDDTLAVLLDKAFTQNSLLEKILQRPASARTWYSIESAADKFRLARGARIGLDYPEDVEVVVGVIDTDIPLGHRAFRNADGTTRVMYHWAMGATERTGDPRETKCERKAKQNQTSKVDPNTYGREFTRTHINCLLKEFSVDGDLLKPLDEDGFNRAIGALDYDNLQGQRGLGQRHSHGAHMLDVAGGCDPLEDAMFAKKVGLVTVNMPSRWQFGEGGEFLDQFMLNAVLRVYENVSSLRSQGHEGASDIPAVTSLAFGRQAGAKRQDTDALSLFLDELSKNQKAGAPPFDLVIPTGNDNLGQVVARYMIGPNETLDVGWRVVPGDQTDNYLETWVEPDAGYGESDDLLAVGLTAPNGTLGVAAHVIQPGEYTDAVKDGEKFAARIYRFTKPEPRTVQLTGYLMALGPVMPRGDSLGAVASGLWTVHLKNTSDKAIEVHLSVQTDQSVHPVAQVSGRSYLDDLSYKRFDGSGRRMDALKYQDPDWLSTEGDYGTRRHGTMNVAASQNLTAVVGGYRTSDGMPAIYASSGLGPDANPERRGPSVALPTDDSAVLGGTLAAGSADGSRVAMRGTSFAASKATRVVANEWLKNKASRHLPAKSILQQEAVEFEVHAPYKTAPYNFKEASHASAFAKFGFGRVPFKPETAKHRKNG